MTSEFRLSLTILALSILGVFWGWQPAAAATITIQPISQTVLVGDSVQVSIDVIGAVDLYGFQFDIEYDPLILEAVDVAEGDFLSTGGGTAFVPGLIDASGIVAFIANALTGAVPGVNGDGHLALLTFTALHTGTSALSPMNIFLLDSSLVDIPATSEAGSVSVTSGTTVPEASSWLLLMTGAGAFWTRYRRQKHGR